MKKVLFIRPSSCEEGTIAWCASGSQQVETLESEQALRQLTGHPLAGRVCLLLPASEMIFRHFTLPKKGLSAQAAPFSWLAEETLLGDVDNLHWTVLRRKGREVDAVAIDSGRFQAWLARFADAGLNVVQVLPDALLLPVAEGGRTLVALDDGYWLRFADDSACVTDAGLLPLLLNKGDDGALCCYGEAPAGIRVDEQMPWQHPLVLIQPQWAQCRANMRHGEFAPQVGGGAFPHAKTAMAAMALLSVGLLLGPRAGMAWMLVQQENQAQQKIVEVAQHYFPGLRQTSNIKYHFGQNLKKVKKGPFLQLAALEQIKQSVPDLEVNEVEYDNNQKQLTLSVTAASPSALQTFVARASDRFDFAIQPVSTAAPWTAIITGKVK